MNTLADSWYRALLHHGACNRHIRVVLSWPTLAPCSLCIVRDCGDRRA